MKALLYKRSMVGGLIFAAVVAIVGVGSLVPDGNVVYGQSSEEEIPNMIGVWNGHVAGYFFQDARSPNYEPVYVERASGEPFRITHQTGRFFAGRAGRPEFPDYAQGRITGVVAPDGTVTIQLFELSELRTFLRGTVKISGDRFELTAHAHLFDDLNVSQAGSMGSGQFYYTKVN